MCNVYCTQELPEQVDLATLDLSFISVLKARGALHPAVVCTAAVPAHALANPHACSGSPPALTVQRQSVSPRMRARLSGTQSAGSRTATLRCCACADARRVRGAGAPCCAVCAERESATGGAYQAAVRGAAGAGVRPRPHAQRRSIQPAISSALPQPALTPANTASLSTH